MAAEPRTIRLVYITTVPITLNFIKGGLARYVKARGIEFHALSSPGEELDRFGAGEGVPVHAIGMSRRITPLRDLGALFELWRRLRRIGPEIVHAGTAKGGLLGIIGAWLARVPVRIHCIHGIGFVTATGYKRILLRCSDKVSCLLAHQVLCASHSIRQIAVEEGVCPSAKAKVLLHGSFSGVDAGGRFNPARFGEIARRDTRAQYGIPDDALVVSFVGRIVRDKGLVELVGAWKMLRERFTTLHLLVAGPFEPQDPVPPDVKQAMRNDPRVHLPGFVDDVPRVYAITDVLALPTYREGFGQVIIEASAMEVPVVATRIPGCVDSVQDGVTGTLVPPRDAQALADAIQMYLNDPDLRREHGRAGRERALRDFRPETIWAATYEEYVRLLRKRRLPVPIPQPLLAEAPVD